MNNLPDTTEEFATKWALEIWAIVEMADWEDGEPVLREKDITKIGKAVLELNKDFNKPEIKALYRHLGMARVPDTLPPSFEAVEVVRLQQPRVEEADEGSFGPTG